GETPKRVENRVAPEPSKIPNANELLKEGKQKEAPRRLSQFRSRDSILEKPFVVLSPDALKGTLRSELDDINETSEVSYAAIFDLFFKN
ncbi:unnamed protein product, partial [Gongylonema pulchrum]|uniref:Centromere protein U n=1 Tax=Gongylonema pulchrum TaxID=637853 RepID=A0A183DXF7_9BILA